MQLLQENSVCGILPILIACLVACLIYIACMKSNVGITAVPILIMTMKISYLQEKNLFLRGFNAAVILCQKRRQNAGEKRRREKTVFILSY